MKQRLESSIEHLLKNDKLTLKLEEDKDSIQESLEELNKNLIKYQHTEEEKDQDPLFKINLTIEPFPIDEQSITT